MVILNLDRNISGILVGTNTPTTVIYYYTEKLEALYSP